MTKPLILIDGSSYFYRAFHALPPLKNSKGQPTGAIFGVASMIKRILKTHQPRHIAVIFDAKGKTFRDEWYPEYKANRAPTPDELSVQFDPLKAFLSAMGLPLLVIPGVEADDVIATLALQASAAGMPVLISTGDKDMAQLVNQDITLVNTMSDQILDVEGVKNKFGVMPEQIIDYLTLVGDTSDNVPGVPKCGPKTAVSWLTTYGNLDAIIQHADQFSGKIGEHLRASLAHLPLSKRLITLKTDVDLPLPPTELLLQPPDETQLQTLANDLEFKNWLRANPATEAKTPAPQHSQDYLTITTEKAWVTYLDALRQSDLICVDTETTHIEAMNASLVGIALQIDGQAPAYIPLMHEDGTTQLSRASVLADLKPILENPKIEKLGQNLKYDYIIFKHDDISLANVRYDTMLESYLLATASRRHDLDSLAAKYLDHTTIKFTDVAGKGAKQLQFNQIPVAEAAPYAAEDAMITLQLHHTLYPLLSPTLQTLLQTIEMPLVTILAEIERHGVLIDSQRLAEHGDRLKAQLSELEQRAIVLAGKPFNLNSPKQLQSILYEDLQLPIRSKTPTGQPSTAEETLQELATDYELPQIILDYRSLNKLVSTYIDALPKKINPRTGRVHTSYNQAITTTGRLSSSDPNLQNIPIRSEEGRLIRRAFIAPSQHQLLAADYSQIELRIMAHLSQDPQLIAAFSAGLDIHAATASEISGVPLAAVSADMRRQAKAINFGLIYGMSAFGLAKQLGIPRQKAQSYIDSYFERYPGVLAYMDKTRALAHEQGYVETIFGRRLELPDINARSMLQRKAAERAAINAPLQGTAADLIKKAMIAVYGWQSQFKEPPATMIMQVHDELVFEVQEENLEMVTQQVKTLMETTVTLSVPLIVSIGVGPSWDETH
ncbi:MAG: DNA polymerase I [Gammaproteobacteria bacterium]|nr:DNA polymerase I [Gammaproteobacteria bacterium]